QYAWEGLDPQTGKVTKRLLQPKEFRYKHRCSADVAAGNVIMCGSMAFADLTTGDYRRFGAARTSCRSAGLVPANGLTYTFPHACGCYDMLRGFLALETDPKAGSPAPSAENRLVKGPAYGAAASGKASASDWPTYRRDVARSGATSATGPDELTKLWEHQVGGRIPESVALEWDQKDGGRLTSPVAAGGLALVADSDFHQLTALDAVSGRLRWTFTAGGRIDCPPTVHDGLCLIGSRDGWVYCLTADEGELVWRFRAAPVNRRIVAYGQLESARPVTGGVLVYEDLAYFVVGRHGASDGGLLVQAVEPKTGKLVWAANAEGHNGVPDVLTAGGGTIQMASWEVDAATGKPRSAGQGRLRGGRLGLLNDAWYKRPIATRRNLSQWAAGDRPTGQMLVFNQTATCGYRACGKVNTGDGEMSGDALLFAKPVSGKEWSVKMPNTARLQGMVLTGERLYAAGLFHKDEDEKDKPASRVRIYNLSDGELSAEYAVDERLVHDCLAIADGRLYVSTQAGKLICLGSE
ncbi:MAG: PQQ-binding-like beta-propeller repeat protein, partial [Planctomycetales bacterium]